MPYSCAAVWLRRCLRRRRTNHRTRPHTSTPPTEPTTLPTMVPTLLLAELVVAGVLSMEPLSHFSYAAALVVMVDVGMVMDEGAPVALAKVMVVGRPVLKEVVESVNSYCCV